MSCGSAAATLQDGVADFRQILEAIPAMVFTTRADGFCDYQSQQWVDYTGIAVSEHLGDGWNMLLHPEDQPRALTAWRDAVAGRAPYDLEYRVRRFDGAYEWFRVIGHPMRDASGRIVRWFGVAVNIEKLKQTKAALRDSEHRLATIVNSAMDAIILVDAQQRIRHFNSAAERMFGLSANEAIGTCLTRLVQGQILAADGDRHTGAASETSGRREEIRGRRVNGETFPIEASVSRSETSDGVVLTLVFRDITERKQAEDALLESRERLSGIINAAMDAIVSVDAQQRIIGFNPAAERMFGLTSVEAMGENLERLMPERFRSAHKYEVRNFGRIRSPARRMGSAGEITGVRRDGQEFPIESSVSQISVGGKDIFTAILRDISKRKQMEASLRESESRFRALFESSADALLLVDETGILDCNAAAVRVYGCSSRYDLVGAPPGRFSPPMQPSSEASLDLIRKRVATALKEGSSAFEWRHRRLDGSEFDAEILLTRIELQSKPVLEASVRDITARTEMLAALARAKESAEQASRAKSQFLANMSHEIRTPLNAVLGLVQLLRREDPSPRQIDRLGKIDIAARHLLAVINDILDFSKIEAGMLRLEESDFTLSSVLDDVYSLIVESAHAKNLALTVDLNGAPLWLRGDPTRIRQALLNFATNAVKFTQSGSISLQVHLLEERNDRVLLRFEVVDTGIGIEATQLSRLFQAFEQADLSTTRRFGGTGLGLAITQRLADLMGGEAGAESTQGQGSRFWFTTWLGRARSIQPCMSGAFDAEAELRTRHGGRRLLLVEDNAVNREVALALLTSIGFAVETADDGRVAVEMARDRCYDLVLMDMQMPTLDGLDATREIRALPGGDGLPILAMTANAFDEARAACLDAGMDDFVPKPIEAKVLCSKLLRWLPDGARVTEREEAAPAEPQPWPATQARILACLADVPGIDVARGMAALRWSQERYVALMRLFVNNHRDDMDRLATLLAHGDDKAAARVAHAFKGAAGMLGLVRLANAADSIERLLKVAVAGRDDSQARLVIEEIRPTMDLLDSILS